MRVACPISLTDEEQCILDNLAQNGSTSARMTLRARIILLANSGMLNNQIAVNLNTDPHTVGRWRSRFYKDRLEGLYQRKSSINGSRAAKRQEITHLILNKMKNEVPVRGSRWTVRTLAAELGISRSTVHRVWQASGLQPHLRKNGNGHTHSEVIPKPSVVIPEPPGGILQPPEATPEPDLCAS